MSNIKDVPMTMVLLSYFVRYGAWRTDLRTYVRMDTHVEIDELPNFLSYGAPLTRLQRAGAPL